LHAVIFINSYLKVAFAPLKDSVTPYELYFLEIVLCGHRRYKRNNWMVCDKLFIVVADTGKHISWHRSCAGIRSSVGPLAISNINVL